MYAIAKDKMLYVAIIVIKRIDDVDIVYILSDKDVNYQKIKDLSFNFRSIEEIFLMNYIESDFHVNRFNHSISFRIDNF